LATVTKRRKERVLPEPIPILKDKAAEQFREYDAKPLDEEEIRSLRKADEIFARHKPR